MKGVFFFFLFKEFRAGLSLFHQNRHCWGYRDRESTFDGTDGGRRESAREIVVDSGRIGGWVVVVVMMTTTRRRTTTTTIPQVQHGHWRTGRDDIFHRHLLLIRLVVVVILLMVRMIRPGRVKTRLAGRRQSTRFHHSN